MLTININTPVQVVLTPEGITKLEQSDVSTSWRRWIRGGEAALRIELPLWQLMAVFGPHSYVGAHPYFVSNDIILTGRVTHI
jgi:hypothetical protein